MTSRSPAKSENPLVPHAVLRSIYLSLLEARLLDQRLESRKARREPALLTACRAAAGACIKPGDLVSDISESPAADRMLGAELRDVLAKYAAAEKGKHAAPLLAASRLPRSSSPQEQLEIALGAAHALRLQRTGGVVWVFCLAQHEAGTWREALGHAGRHELPMVFVLAPATATTARSSPPGGMVSDRARAWGVPGMPVDASDTVALYRVLSEANLRARSGDGPSLVEGVLWRPQGSRTRPADPLLALSLALVSRGAATTGWQSRVGARMEARMPRPRPSR